MDKRRICVTVKDGTEYFGRYYCEYENHIRLLEERSSFNLATITIPKSDIKEITEYVPANNERHALSRPSTGAEG